MMTLTTLPVKGPASIHCSKGTLAPSTQPALTVKLMHLTLPTCCYHRIDPDLSGAWPPRFTKLDFELDDGTCLAFTDSRRFAKVKWLVSSFGAAAGELP